MYFILKELISHNPYFNRWFSAIVFSEYMQYYAMSHNPYFNRWFSAISNPWMEEEPEVESQSLF